MRPVSRRQPLKLTPEQRRKLRELARSRTHKHRLVLRARILLAYCARSPVAAIARRLDTTRRTVYKCIDKALAMGVEAGLHDLYHRPRAPVLTQEAKAWVRALACTKPTAYGLFGERWTRQALAQYVRKYGPYAGHFCLAKTAKATVHRILESEPVRPHTVKHFLTTPTAENDRSTKEVLLVYQDLQLANIFEPAPPSARRLQTERAYQQPPTPPGTLFIPGLAAWPRSDRSLTRSSPHTPLRAASLLVAVDLQDGHVFAQLYRQHGSHEFINILKELDAYYLPAAQIRLILDNHASHFSKETRAFLVSRPNRFLYVHQPLLGSRLNIIETLLTQVVRSALRHTPSTSCEDLQEQILRGLQEVNGAPVVQRWKN